FDKSIVTCSQHADAGSVASFQVDRYFLCSALADCSEIEGRLLRNDSGGRARGNMRGDQNTFIIPEWMSRRQWFDVEGVQCYGADLALVKCCEQVILDEMRTAAHIDQVCATRQLPHQRQIQKSRRFAGQRQ